MVFIDDIIIEFPLSAKPTKGHYITYWEVRKSLVFSVYSNVKMNPIQTMGVITISITIVHDKDNGINGVL